MDRWSLCLNLNALCSITVVIHQYSRALSLAAAATPLLHHHGIWSTFHLVPREPLASSAPSPPSGAEASLTASEPQRPELATRAPWSVDKATAPRCPSDCGPPWSCSGQREPLSLTSPPPRRCDHRLIQSQMVQGGFNSKHAERRLQSTPGH